MNISSRKPALACTLMFLAPTLAQAHILPGGGTGLSEGFAHPWAGWDHLLVMLAVGFWSAQQGGRWPWRLPLVFASVMTLGGIGGVIGIRVPGAEPIILLSVPIFGVLAARRVRLRFSVAALLVGLFAFFHGLAHGIEMPVSASLGSFAVGFVLATLLLHGLGLAGARLLVLVAACSVGNRAEAGRPFAIDDAGPVEPQMFEVELGASYFQQPSTRHWHVPLNLAYGVIPRLELGVSAGQHFWTSEASDGTSVSEVGFGDVGLGLKWQPLDADRFLADQALAFNAKVPIASQDNGLGTGEVDFDLTWIASKPLTDGLFVDVNAGYSWLGDLPGARISDVVHYGAALRWSATKRFELGGEVYALHAVDESGVEGVFGNAGVRWRAFEHLVLDAALGGKLHGTGPDFTATFGLTWKFNPFKRRVRTARI